jgi:hypothetical protein
MKSKAPRLSGLDADQLELVQKMLVYSPEKRASAAELLATVKSLLPEGSLRKQENTNVRPVRSVPQVNRDLLAEFKMGFQKQQTRKAATQSGPAIPKLIGPWPSMLTSAFLTLFGPLGTGLRFSYLEQNPASHPLAQMERQLVATLFGLTSFGIATPFIGWKWFRASRKSFDLLLAGLSLLMVVGIFVLFAVGTLSGQESEIYGLTTSIASICLVALFTLIPLVGFRAPKLEKPKMEEGPAEQI